MARNETPRAYARGIRAESQDKLRLPAIFLSLLLDVASDDVFVDTNRGDKITIRPDSASFPIYQVKKIKMFTKRFGGVGFYQADHLANRILWRNGDLQMNMVIV